MTDRQLIELLWPLTAMKWMLLDGVEARNKADPVYVQTMADISLAQEELLETAGKTREGPKLARRICRVLEAVINPYSKDCQEVGKVALIVFYVIQRLVETGYIAFSDGTATDRAVTAFMAAIEHHAECEPKRRSAEKQARKMLAALQGMGLYRGVEMDGRAAA